MKIDYRDNLFKSLRAIRAVENLTQSQMSKIMDITIPTYRNLENGFSAINLKHLEKIESELGYSVMDLLDGILIKNLNKSHQQ